MSDAGLFLLGIPNLPGVEPAEIYVERGSKAVDLRSGWHQDLQSIANLIESILAALRRWRRTVEKQPLQGFEAIEGAGPDVVDGRWQGNDLQIAPSRNDLIVLIDHFKQMVGQPPDIQFVGNNKFVV